MGSEIETTHRSILRDISLAGPVNGMNELDPSGSYLRLVLTRHDLREERLISLGAAEVFVAEAAGMMHGIAASQSAPGYPTRADAVKAARAFYAKGNGVLGIEGSDFRITQTDEGLWNFEAGLDGQSN